MACKLNLAIEFNINVERTNTSSKIKLQNFVHVPEVLFLINLLPEKVSQVWEKNWRCVSLIKKKNKKNWKLMKISLIFMRAYKKI